MDPKMPPNHARNLSAWIVFALFGVLFLIYGIYAFALPSVEPTHWDDIASSSSTILYIADNFRWIGMHSGMFGVLTIAVAYGGLRRGIRWAWLSFLSFPIFFSLAIFFTWPGLMWAPFLVAALVALWVTYGPTFHTR